MNDLLFLSRELMYLLLECQKYTIISIFYRDNKWNSIINTCQEDPHVSK